MVENAKGSMWRSRWAAVGAAVAVTLGFGTFGIANATIASGERAVFVPITPCRLLDTRGAAPVGPRGVPITAGEEFRAQVWGANGDCNVSSGASAVVMNVTAVAPTNAGFITVWPSNVARPNSSSLNFAGGQTIPNEVTSRIGGDGGVKFYTTADSLDLIADVVGYYENHNHNDLYTNNPGSNNTTIIKGGNVEGNTVRMVTGDGSPATNGANLRGALAGFSGPGIVRLAPGLYDLGNGGITVPDKVVLRGSGQSVTTIQTADAGASPIVMMAGAGELSDLTITGITGGSAGVKSAALAGTKVYLHHLTVTMRQDQPKNVSLGAIYNQLTGDMAIDHVTARSVYGVTNGSGTMEISDSDMDTVNQYGSGTVVVQNSRLTPNLSTDPGVSSQPLVGGAGGVARVDNVDIIGQSRGLWDYPGGTILVSNSRITATFPRYQGSGGTIHCTNVVKGDYITPLNGACA